jgi:hypothetical protein
MYQKTTVLPNFQIFRPGKVFPPVIFVLNKCAVNSLQHLIKLKNLFSRSKRIFRIPNTSGPCRDPDPDPDSHAALNVDPN